MMKLRFPRDRRRRLAPLVRLQMVAPAPEEGLAERAEPAMEGVLVGLWNEHYVLEHAKLLMGEDAGTTSLGGRQYVHRARVLFVQELELVEIGGSA